MQFKNRDDAGRLLAQQMSMSLFPDAYVLALPRGGVPVAAPIARKLKAPFDVLLVRKLGHPQQPEYALGALVEDGTLWMNPSFSETGRVSEKTLEHLRKTEGERIASQKQVFREGRELPNLKDKTVILVDDGIATGATVMAAVKSLKKQDCGRIVVAVPICAADSTDAIRKEGAEVFALVETDQLQAVGLWYQDFSQVENETVLRILTDFRAPPPAEVNSSASLKKSSKMVSTIADLLQPLEIDEDLAPLLQHVKDKRVVMLGESTHGTSEYYRIRDRISRYLLRNHGFSFVSVEGDWPDLEKLNRYSSKGRGRSAKSVMQAFRRWPTWMWANEEVVEFVEFLKSEKSVSECGFYGLDIYSLFESIDSVLEYVQKVNPFLSKAMKARYSCFEPFERDEYAYARSLQRIPEGCSAQVMQNLDAILKIRLEKGQDPDEYFGAEQNARIVVNAENYYRALLSGDELSWNVRDSHMLDTLELLLDRCEKMGRSSKGIVWAHNTHVGDYRATDMEREGYVNLGGLARKTYGESDVGLIGFGTYSGKVVAAQAWGGKEQVMVVPPAQKDTYEAYFHEALQLRKMKQGYILMGPQEKEGILKEIHGHRAIGVVYHNQRENRGNYVPTSLSHRYDAFVFVDQTSALHSLHALHEHGKFPETWPQGM